MWWATSVSVGRLVTPLSVAIHRSNHCYLYFSFITLAGWWRQKDFIFETASNPKDESFDLITESRVATSSNVSTHQNNLETKSKKMFTVVWCWWTSDYASLREYIYISLIVRCSNNNRLERFCIRFVVFALIQTYRLLWMIITIWLRICQFVSICI